MALARCGSPRNRLPTRREPLRKGRTKPMPLASFCKFPRPIRDRALEKSHGVGFSIVRPRASPTCGQRHQTALKVPSNRFTFHPLKSRGYAFVFPYHTFCRPKGMLLHDETIPFARQNHTYRIALKHNALRHTFHSMRKKEKCLHSTAFIHHSLGGWKIALPCCTKDEQKHKKLLFIHFKTSTTSKFGAKPCTYFYTVLNLFSKIAR